MSSQTATPLLEPTITRHPTQPPSPSTSTISGSSFSGSSSAAAPLIPEDDIPDLSLETLRDDTSKVAALRLVADSVAQQRQTAARALLTHPVSFAGLFACVAAPCNYYAGGFRNVDVGTGILLAAGIAMTYMLAARYVASGYVHLAETLINRAWLRNPDTAEQDLIIGTRFGGEVIGAVVLRLEPGPPGSAGYSHHHHGGKRRGRNGNGALRGGKGVIRAWTTSLPYRGRGVGTDLLDEAVRLTREKCGRDAEVGFAKEHANASMVLPELFNGPFRQRERKAAQALKAAVERWEVAKRKKRTASM